MVFVRSVEGSCFSWQDQTIGANQCEPDHDPREVSLMDSCEENPSSNVLGAGVNEDAIRAAVEKSGYPLQTVAAEALRKNFGVTEEWSYVDRSTGDLRAIDILAGLHLYDIETNPRVRPQVNLVIECKQSELPFVFFLTPGRPRCPDFPVIAGLHSNKIVITSDDDPSSWNLPILDALSLSDDEFFTIPKFCTTFSKCVRKGRDIKLSGVDAYNGLILPLITAQQHFVNSEKPISTAAYFDFHLTVAIGIVDAPLVAADCSSDRPGLKLIPWVRAFRHEYSAKEERWDRSKLWAVDIVHKDFLSTYIDKHLIPFALRCAALALKHQKELASGRGFVSKMGRDSWDGIEKRLRPRDSAPRLSRTRALARNIIRLIGKDRNQVDSEKA